jgi:hypothetical protein
MDHHGKFTTVPVMRNRIAAGSPQAARARLAMGRCAKVRTPTPSEEALWQALRGSAFGVAFKRQAYAATNFTNVPTTRRSCCTNAASTTAT